MTTSTPEQPRPRRPYALFSIAGVFIAIVAVLVVLQQERALVLSDVRAYVGGEGLYSKAQKRAVIQLLLYARSGSEDHWREFERALGVPLGDRDARLELLRKHPDVGRAAEGFVRGQNHPAEAERMARFFLRFQDVSYVAEAIRIWTEGDREIAQLQSLGAALRQLIEHDSAPPVALDALLAQLAATDARLTVLEDQFSSTLSEGARFILAVTEDLLIALAVVLLGVGWLYSIRVTGEVRRAEATLRESEERVRGLNEHLERRVQARTGELERSNRELESFNYSVSHDLRAPLGVIACFATMIRTDFADTLPQEAKQHLAHIEQNAAQMSRLIDNLLEFSRMGRAVLARSSVQMRPLVDDVVRELRQEDTLAHPEIGELPPAVGDAELLRQVWHNLIGNALKFSARAAGPRIEIGHAQTADGAAYYVRDNGAGFDMRHASKLFGVFERLHSPSEFEGTGIGLAISKRVVELHGGRIWAHAVPGAGATFWFTLPA
jgi:signal transduction histidine kinase